MFKVTAKMETATKTYSETRVGTDPQAIKDELRRTATKGSTTTYKVTKI